MSTQKKKVSATVAEAQRIIRQCEEAGLTVPQIAAAAALSDQGVYDVKEGKYGTVRRKTLGALNSVLGMLQMGQIGPQMTPQQSEGDMVETYNRDAADAGLPQWDELSERERDRLRAEWREALARQQKLVAEVADVFRQWTMQYVREGRKTL